MNKTKRHKKKLLVLTLVVTIIGTTLIGCSSGIRKKNINLNDYVEVTFNGYEESGTAKATLDYDKITEDYGNKIKLDTDNNMSAWYYGENIGDIIRDYVTVSTNPNTALNNGDTVSLVWYVDEYYIESLLNCTVSYDNKKYIVEGLDNVETVDVFDGIDVSFTGISPLGKADVNTEGQFSSNGYGLPYQWMVIPSENLANGDTVTVSFNVTDMESFVNQYGAVPEYMEKEFAVTGLDSYIIDIATLSDENISALKKEAEDQIDSYCSKNSDVIAGMLTGNYGGSIISYEYNDPILENVYFYVEKNNSDYIKGNLSYVPVFIYSTNISAETKLGFIRDNGSEDFYFAITFNNLILENNDNLVGITDNSIKYYTSYDKTYTEWITSNKDNYNITIYDASLNMVE